MNTESPPPRKKQEYEPKMKDRTTMDVKQRIAHLVKRWTLPVLAVLSLIWILIRVIPKPQRATYPCMRVAFPFAASLIAYAATLGTSLLFFRQALGKILRRRYFPAMLLLVAALVFGMGSLFTQQKQARALEKSASPGIMSAAGLDTFQDPLGPNQPIGQARGIFPGRVVWAHNPDATNEDCVPHQWGDGYFLDKNCDQDIVDAMLDTALLQLTGEATAAEAWDAVFRYHNSTRDKGDAGYSPGEKIFIKVNAVHAWSTHKDLSIKDDSNYGNVDTSPQVILAVLRQLIHQAGVPQEAIYIGDPFTQIFKHVHDKLSAEFPGVHYMSKDEVELRERLLATNSDTLYYSEKGTILDKAWETFFDVHVEADYILSIPALKGHRWGGVTFFAKNHFGSNTNFDSQHLHKGLHRDAYEAPIRGEYRSYRVMTDLMAYEHLGGKTLIYIGDFLWGTSYEHHPPARFRMVPFRDDWTSSILASLDPVAISSVSLDILQEELQVEDLEADPPRYTYVRFPAVDDYLHQAASSEWWPEGIVYDPENDGTPMGSLGVHEHWNNPTDMQYSRNLGTGEGIELLYLNTQVLDKPESEKLGFFNEHWEQRWAETPPHQASQGSGGLPTTVITIDGGDTVAPVSPYIGGYNLNTFFGGKVYDKPGLLVHIRHLELPFYRYPGGSGSNFFFWDAEKPTRPGDVDSYLVKGEVKNTIKWGDEPANSDYLSLDNYHRLRDSTSSQGVNVVNYSYARYGRSDDPVAQAAHHAAQWVRRDAGRTLFWEIGNENYGKWEAGYEIDTTLNRDGQPQFLTGTLYAEHALVFLDSMRAAAAEAGAEIRIGAVLGFKNQYDSWNRQVLEILGNSCDFYSLHKYYGNWNDANPTQVLTAITEFYSDKDYVDGLIADYCDPIVPLIHTEWNVRYSGSRQNVSCASGMFTMQGYKAIITSGIGLSSKWNLIWGYSDGDTHGLISNARDNPGVEGIPAFTPRAPYYYAYHFRKVLGDVAVHASQSKNSTLDLFASAFSSGHLGVVVVNRGSSEVTAGMNLVNFEKGRTCYRYALTPKDGDPFSPKVLINGVENTEHDAGGPLNYASIPAEALAMNSELVLDFPAWSVTYLLLEGDAEMLPPGSPMDFNIWGRTPEGVAPLEGAVIRIDGQVLLTDENGDVSAELEKGFLGYKLEAEGFMPKQGILMTPGNGYFSDTLDMQGLWVGPAAAGESLRLYPNPAMDQLQIGHSRPISRAYICYASGALAMELPEQGHAEAWTADVGALPEGLYVVVVQDGEGQRTSQKLMIQR